MQERSERVAPLRGLERAVWIDGCLRLAARLLRRGVPAHEGAYRAHWHQTIRRIIARRNGEEAARQWDALSDEAKSERMNRTPLSLEKFRAAVIENVFSTPPPTWDRENTATNPWRWN